ncbi:major facilitator superfamily domain-containing protein 6-A-like [Argiope bruennichi]|uniref:major facilitator superfamily domain-containing protein 6-A-like n=1 Tax=Argiope bruennichi TaxID=94029 RepID=UPI0024955563|nr:major facilitator superfamily domain-containing protein 6-A-like [Argiope bruennichi]
MDSERERNVAHCEESRKATSFWHVDREMLRFKIHFFLFIGALSAAIPFIVVFAKERLGLSPSSLGAVLTAQMFLFIFTKPLIGYIADYFNRLKSIIVVLTVTIGVCYFCLLAIPKFEREPSITFSQEGMLHATFCRTCEDLFKFRHAEANFSMTEMLNNYFNTRNESCQLCSQCTICTLNATNKSFFKAQNFLNDSYEYRQNEQNNNGRKLSIVCYKDDSINISLCSCIANSSKNFNSDCTKIFCSDMWYIKEKGHYFKNISALFPKLSKNLTELCSFLNASTNLEVHRNIPQTNSMNDFQTMQFWIFAFLFSLSSICGNATFTLSDTACCESIQKNGADFGKQRMWGSVGWGLIAPIAGFLNDCTDDFLYSWILMAVMLLFFLGNLSTLDLLKPHYSTNILGDVGKVLKSKEFLAYELVIFMNGISTGMIWFYLIWFLTSIGGSELLCGLCIAVQCFCGAIPFMFFSGWVIRKVGCFQILSAALLTYVVRFLWYSYLYNPWWVLPVECCHGITYGLYYTVLAHYGKKNSKPGAEATTQSILFSTHEGLGAGLGCVLSGIGFDYIGGRETFFAASMFCGCGFIISIVLFITIIRQKRAEEITATSHTRDANAAAVKSSQPASRDTLA